MCGSNRQFTCEPVKKPGRSSGPDCDNGITIWGKWAISARLIAVLAEVRMTVSKMIHGSSVKTKGRSRSPPLSALCSRVHIFDTGWDGKGALWEIAGPLLQMHVYRQNHPEHRSFSFVKEGRDPNGSVSPCASDFFQPASEGAKTPENRGRESRFHEKPRC
jgi:hypothetical protein